MDIALNCEIIEQAIAHQLPVHVYLVNGIKLTGILLNSDQHTLMLSGQTPQIIYKHVVATVLLTNGTSQKKH